MSLTHYSTSLAYQLHIGQLLGMILPLLLELLREMRKGHVRKTCAPRRVSTKVLLAAAVTREEVLTEVGGASFHRAAQGQLRRRAGIRRALLRASRR